MRKKRDDRTMATFTNQAANLSALGSRFSRLLTVNVSDDAALDVDDGERFVFRRPFAASQRSVPVVWPVVPFYADFKFVPSVLLPPTNSTFSCSHRDETKTSEKLLDDANRSGAQN